MLRPTLMVLTKLYDKTMLEGHVIPSTPHECAVHSSLKPLVDRVMKCLRDPVDHMRPQDVWTAFSALRHELNHGVGSQTTFSLVTHPSPRPSPTQPHTRADDVVFCSRGSVGPSSPIHANAHTHTHTHA